MTDPGHDTVALPDQPPIQQAPPYLPRQQDHDDGAEIGRSGPV